MRLFFVEGPLFCWLEAKKQTYQNLRCQRISDLISEKECVMNWEGIRVKLHRRKQMDEESTKGNRLKAVLSEYAKLRDEIDRRSRDQLYCVTVSVIAVGTIAGIVIRNPEDNHILLLVIPWILTVFGILWLDLANGISKLGRYIKHDMEEKKIRQLLGPGDWLGWQKFIFNATKKRRMFIEFFLPLFYFILPLIFVFVLFCLRFPDQLTRFLLALTIAFYSVLIGTLIWKWTQAMDRVKKGERG